jgi:hypothetical protein
MVGSPTVTIPFCILFNTVIPVTVEIIVKVLHLDKVGYVTVSVNTCPSSSSLTTDTPSISLDRLDNSISAIAAVKFPPACILQTHTAQISPVLRMEESTTKE